MLLYVACLHTVTHPCDIQPLAQKEGNYKYRSDAMATFLLLLVLLRLLFKAATI